MNIAKYELESPTGVVNTLRLEVEKGQDPVERGKRWVLDTLGKQYKVRFIKIL